MYDIERKNAFEYIKEINESIPGKKSLLGRKISVDTSKLSEIKDKIEMFYERGTLISPMYIDKNSIDSYIQTVDLVKQFPSEYQPDDIIESKLLEQTKNIKNTRRILLPGVIEENKQVMESYNKMVAHYLLMGGDNPIQRFSKTEMSMKQYGVTPDIGMAIMKYADEITTKLEEIASLKTKSPKEWECFKTQVLHSFGIAEKIGNRRVNPEEHAKLEDRLVRLGILERRIDQENETKKTFKDSLRIDTSSNDGPDKQDSKQLVSLEAAIQKNAEQMYINTGMVPLGYIKTKEGKIERKEPKISLSDERKDRLSASRNNLSATKKQEQQFER